MTDEAADREFQYEYSKLDRSVKLSRLRSSLNLEKFSVEKLAGLRVENGDNARPQISDELLTRDISI